MSMMWWEAQGKHSFYCEKREKKVPGFHSIAGLTRKGGTKAEQTLGGFRFLLSQDYLQGGKKI
jgi:hypothetical protein